jgi:hypothetical protein
MTRKPISTLLFLSVFLVSATAKLLIQSPNKLADMFSVQQKGFVPASYANFGLVPYGHSIVSFIYFPGGFSHLRRESEWM